MSKSGPSASNSPSAFRSFYQNDAYYTSQDPSGKEQKQSFSQHEDSYPLSNTANLKSVVDVSGSSWAATNENKKAVAANIYLSTDLVKSKWTETPEQQRLNTEQLLPTRLQEGDLSSKIYLTGLDGLGTRDVEQFLREHTSRHKPADITWCDDRSALITYQASFTAIEALKLLSTGSKSRTKNNFEFRLAQPYGKDRLRPINVRLALHGDLEKYKATLGEVRPDIQVKEPPSKSQMPCTGHPENSDTKELRRNANAKNNETQSLLNKTLPVGDFTQPEIPKVRFDFRSEEHNANFSQTACSKVEPRHPRGNALFSVPPPKEGLSGWEANRSIKVTYGVNKPKSQGPSVAPLFSLPDSLKGPPKFERSRNISHSSTDEFIRKESDSSNHPTEERSDKISADGSKTHFEAAAKNSPSADKINELSIKEPTLTKDSDDGDAKLKKRPSIRGPLFALPASLAAAGPRQPRPSHILPMTAKPQPELGTETLAWESRNKRRLQYLSVHHSPENSSDEFRHDVWQSNAASTPTIAIMEQQRHLQDRESIVPSQPMLKPPSHKTPSDELLNNQISNSAPKAKPAILIAEAVKRWSQTRTAPSSSAAGSPLGETSRSLLSFKQQALPSSHSEQEEGLESIAATNELATCNEMAETSNANQIAQTIENKGSVASPKAVPQLTQGQPLPLRASQLSLDESNSPDANTISTATHDLKKASSFEWSFDDDTPNASLKPALNIASSALAQKECKHTKEQVTSRFKADGAIKPNMPETLHATPAKDGNVLQKLQPLSSTPKKSETPQSSSSLANSSPDFATSPSSSGKNLRPDVAPFFPVSAPLPIHRFTEHLKSHSTPNEADGEANGQNVINSHLNRLMTQVTSLEAQIEIIREEIAAARAAGAGKSNDN